MYNIELIRLQLNHLVTQARQDIFTLLNINDLPMKQQILQRLWDTISSIHFLSDLLATQFISHNQVPQSSTTYPTGTTQLPTASAMPAPNSSITTTNQRIFTIEELAKYNGKNGMSAYVAVNGTVYDVTNNRAWAAATHFALTAGKDYTKEFASCHAGQQSILEALPVVGRLANGRKTYFATRIFNQ